MEGQPTKRCPRCGRTLPHAEFNKNRANRPASLGLAAWCKACESRFNVEAQRLRRLRKLSTPQLLRALELARNAVSQIQSLLADRGEVTSG